MIERLMGVAATEWWAPLSPYGVRTDGLHENTSVHFPPARDSRAER
jgi:hypothetical protein